MAQNLDVDMVGALRIQGLKASGDLEHPVFGVVVDGGREAIGRAAPRRFAQSLWGQLAKARHVEGQDPVVGASEGSHQVGMAGQHGDGPTDELFAWPSGFGCDTERWGLPEAGRPGRSSFTTGGCLDRPVAVLRLTTSTVARRHPTPPLVVDPPSPGPVTTERGGDRVIQGTRSDALVDHRKGSVLGVSRAIA